ncbi:MAG: hypothetical protein V1647_06625 [Pseudomonadota bacterium]
MKKLLVLGVSAVVLVAIASCGGSGSTATDSQAGVAAGVVVPALASGASTASLATIDEAVTYPVDVTFHCDTSGDVTTTGNVEVDVGTETATINGTLESAFNSCAGTDTRCSIDYVLGGSVTSTTSASVSGTDVQIAVTQAGTVNVTGFATFDCVIDTVTTISYDQLSTLDDGTCSGILDYMTGTICGKTVAEIKTLIDGDDTTYCQTISDLANNNS